MDCLVDTNILVYLTQSDNNYVLARSAIMKLQAINADLWIVPQVLIEAYSVMTKPLAQHGKLGYTSADALVWLGNFEATFGLLNEEPEIYPGWLRLLTAFPVVGAQCHDRRIAATMLEYGVSHLLTNNPSDFQGIPGITVIDMKNPMF